MQIGGEFGVQPVALTLAPILRVCLPLLPPLVNPFFWANWHPMDRLSVAALQGTKALSPEQANPAPHLINEASFFGNDSNAALTAAKAAESAAARAVLCT